MSAAGKGCPKCGGLRQWPMGCVIRLPDEECGAEQVDVLGIAGDFVGRAGSVLPPEDTPNPAGILFRVYIKAPRLQRADGRYIDSRDAATLYRNAVVAEMSQSVKASVEVIGSSIGHESARKFAEDYPGKKAVVEVRAVKNAGTLTNLGMSYMFQLRDSVLAVIRDVEPPDGAWVADDAPQQPEKERLPMDDTDQAPYTAPLSSSAPPSPVPQLDADAHAQPIALAAAGVHYTGSSPEYLERVSQNYLPEARQFIAMFNTAFLALDSSTRERNPAQEVSAAEADANA